MQPIKLLESFLRDVVPVAVWEDGAIVGDSWVGMPREWSATIDINPQLHSDDTTLPNPMYYTGLNVVVGDYLVTTSKGFILRVKQVISQTDNVVECILEDEDGSNLLQNPAQSGEGGIPEGDGFIFAVKNGFPLLRPLPDGLPASFSPWFAVDLFSRFFQKLTPSSGGGDTTNTKILPAGEDLAAGDMVNIFDDAGTAKVRKADVSAVNQRIAHGFVKTTVTSGANVTVYFEGVNNAKSGLTVGAEYYCDPLVPGAVVTYAGGTWATGDLVQRVGNAIGATELSFEAAFSPVELA